MTCAAPLGPKLLDWWLDDLADAADADAAERHLFECAECAAGLAGLVEGSRALADFVAPVVTRRRLAVLSTRMVVRTTDVAPDGDVRVPFPADVDLVVHKLRLPAGDWGRLDGTARTPEGTLIGRVDGAPCEGGEILIACTHALADANPSGTVDVEVTTPASDGGDRLVARYRLVHLRGERG